MPSVVLVTGVSRHLGSRLAEQLSADPAIDRVIGVDTTPPSKSDLARLGRTEFMRADIRNPLIAKLIAQASVETVVHASLSAMPQLSGGRASMKEMNVIGTMQLLAACQKSDTVQRLVVKSTTSVYGSSGHDPAVFTEDMPARRLPNSGYSKDAVEVEGYVRGFSRRRPDISVCVLRFANFIGPNIETPMTRYFAMPVLPTPLGFDPRLQFLHESDAVEILRMAAVADRTGVFNATGEGTLTLSQAVRRAGHVPLPVPSPAVDFVSRLVRTSGQVDFAPDQLKFLLHGRTVDITRLKTVFGYTPEYTTAQAFDDYLERRPISRLYTAGQVRQVEQMVGQQINRALGIGMGVLNRG